MHLNTVGTLVRADIRWTRVQNIYDVIGPSELWSTEPNNPDKFKDLSWRYADCRFIRTENEDSYLDTRHHSVTEALLGNAGINPRGLTIFSTTDLPLSSYSIWSLLYVGSNSGEITQDWRNQTASYYRSAWNLESRNVNVDRLEKIYFYSVLPIQTSSAVLNLHESSYNFVTL